VKHIDRDSHLWHIHYPAPSAEEGVVVATTRPETMLGDTAVAVHPEDERYKDLIGKTVILPLLNRELPVIADEVVDPEFGTGAVKVTPAHDPNDFEMAQRHELETLVAIDEAAVITAVGGPYEGQDRFEAREAVIADLEERGNLKKVEEYKHSVGHCYRCNTVIEPMLSDQWFVKMKPLAEKALEALDRGEPRIQPARWEKVYRHWLENIRDWCISRQIWWGHRIPVWYCSDENGGQHQIASADHPSEPCPECGNTEWEQDRDVLDTWFSSWLWPFSAMGWPDETEDMDIFYPTSLLISGYDILFFWDTRMVMAGLEFTGKVPFETLYIHGMIQDELGRPMSKSLGNGIDPIEMVETYGADAVRYSLAVLTTEGQDMKLAESRFEMGRNFVNKLWNASRLVLMNLDGQEAPVGDLELELADRWIISRFQDTIRAVTVQLENLKYADAARTLYHFVWNDYCDWYLELAKERLREPDSVGAVTARTVLAWLLDGVLRLLHPFMPFVTSEIWGRLSESLQGKLVALTLITSGKGEDLSVASATASLVEREEFLVTAAWPSVVLAAPDVGAERPMTLIQEVVSAIRNIKGEMSVPPGRSGEAHIRTADEDSLATLTKQAEYVTAMASLESVVLGPDVTKPSASGAAVVSGTEVYLPLEGLIDLEIERDRLSKELDRLQSSFRAAEAKLTNGEFIQKAPEEVVAREREKRNDIEERLQKVRDLLADLND
jgi:valyl-tRNA synthetase